MLQVNLLTIQIYQYKPEILIIELLKQKLVADPVMMKFVV